MPTSFQSLAPFTLPFACGDPAILQFSASSSVWKFQTRRGVKPLSAADLLLEVVTGPYYWWTEPVWMDKLGARSGDVSVVQTDNWLNLIKRNFPQSSITGPNNSNVLTVTVFGNLYEEKNTADISGEAPVLPPVLLTICHISAWKTASVTSKKLPASIWL